MKSRLFKRFHKTNFLPTVFVYLAALLFAILPISEAYADIYEFQPTPANLYDLDHTKAYSWGINWNLPVGQTISEAVITFNNINNWDTNKNILYVSLLDSASLGVKQFTDNEGGGNYFSKTGFLLGTYSDTNGIGQTDTVSFSVPSTQYSWLTSGSGGGSNGGNFGFGIDPDCHFYNTGITVTIKTHSVPEPSTWLLICLGFVGLMVFRNRQQDVQEAELPYKWQRLSEI